MKRIVLPKAFEIPRHNPRIPRTKALPALERFVELLFFLATLFIVIAQQLLSWQARRLRES
jgi:hypothetical protein